MILEIIHEGNELLVAENAKVENVADVQQLIADMRETVTNHLATGLGLAAPQVGVNLQVMIMRTGLNSKVTPVEEKPFMALINPEIKKIYGENEVVFREGCLSIPDKICVVKRHKGLKVRYIDEYGNPNTVRFDGIDAVVFQHEYDHLVGKLMNTTEGFQWSTPKDGAAVQVPDDIQEQTEEVAAAAE